MNNDFENYKKTIENIDLQDIENDEEEYMFYLEGKIRYIYINQYNDTFIKKNNSTLKELESLCKEAIEINEYLYNSNHCLADIRKSQKKNSEALVLFSKIYDYGFVTNQIIDNIFFLSVVSSNWLSYKKYLNQNDLVIDKWLLNILFYEYRYHVLLILYVIFCNFFPIMFGWEWALKFILPILSFYILIALIFKRRIYYSYAFYQILILIISIPLYFLLVMAR